MRKAPTRSGRTLRCAVYTRKSSEEGLEQEFNSLQARVWRFTGDATTLAVK
jgi:site-specific DNA recombinase